MKKNLIYILLLFLLSCSAEKQQATMEKQATTEKCPKVLFSKEHKIYISSDQIPLKTENISYRAELNNYLFNKECFVLNNILTFSITLLFVIEPDNITYEDILLPFYIATLNSEDKVLDIQYYKVETTMEKDPQTFNYIETEHAYNIVSRIPNKDIKTNLKTSIVIGFMLNEEKIKLLN